MSKFPFSTSVILFSVFPPSTVAQEHILPEVVVTATRTPQSVLDSYAAVTVISRVEIEQKQAVTLFDLLRGVEGLDMVNNGGLGQATSIFLRGMEADHVLVLVDGIKIGSATLGIASIQDFPVAQIDHIEIVRGPLSSVYGSEAVGGVIQIFTRKSNSQPYTSTSVGTGSDGTYQVTAGAASAMGGNYWYSAQAGYLQSEGFNTCQGNVNGGCFTDEPDKDSYENTSVSVRVGQKVNQQTTVEGHALRVQGETDYDSSGHNHLTFSQQVLGANTSYLVNDSWDLTVSVGESRDEQDNSGNRELPSESYNTKRTTAAWQNNLLLSDAQQLTLGYDYQNDEIDSSVNYTHTSRTNHGYFAHYQHRTIRLGVRQDDNEQFGQHTTYHAGINYPFSASSHVYFSYGTAFKAPTFNELYYPSVGGFPAFGNPNLQPEESQSFELGLKGKQLDYTWSLNAFRTNIDNLIGSYPAENIDKANITGSEATLRWQKDGWEFYTNLTWLKPKDELTGHLLPRRAEQTANLGIAENRGSGRLEMNLFWQNDRYDDLANTQRLDSYYLLNLRGEYRFNKNWTMRAKLDNLLDEEYETIRFYNTPGRTFFVSVEYRQ